ncbi:cat eye syndrome chromosome region, candidate 2 [Sorochytrium milnesiophthora]
MPSTRAQSAAANGTPLPAVKKQSASQVKQDALPQQPHHQQADGNLSDLSDLSSDDAQQKDSKSNGKKKPARRVKTGSTVVNDSTATKDGPPTSRRKRKTPSSSSPATESPAKSSRRARGAGRVNGTIAQSKTRSTTADKTGAPPPPLAVTAAPPKTNVSPSPSPISSPSDLSSDDEDTAITKVRDVDADSLSSLDDTDSTHPDDAMSDQQQADLPPSDLEHAYTFCDLNADLIANADSPVFLDAPLYDSFKLVYVATFCNRFSSFFGIRHFSIHELERELLALPNHDTPSLLPDLIVRLLDAVPLKRRKGFAFIRLADWERAAVSYLRIDTDRKHLFIDMTLQEKLVADMYGAQVDALHDICVQVFQDILEIFDSVRVLSNSMRVEPVGHDSNRSTYWHFGDNRLYIEAEAGEGGDAPKWQLLCHSYDGWVQALRDCRTQDPKGNLPLYRSLRGLLDSQEAYAVRCQAEEAAAKGFKMSRQHRMDRLLKRDIQVSKGKAEADLARQEEEQRREAEEAKRQLAVERRKTRERRAQEQEYAKKAERDLIYRMKQMAKADPSINLDEKTKSRRDYLSGKWDIENCATLRLRINVDAPLGDLFRYRLRSMVNSLRHHPSAGMLVPSASAEVDATPDDLDATGFDEVYRRLLLGRYTTFADLHRDVCHLLNSKLARYDMWSTSHKKLAALQLHYVQKLANLQLLDESQMKRKQNLTRSGRRVRSMYQSDDSSDSGDFSNNVDYEYDDGSKDTEVDGVDTDSSVSVVAAFSSTLSVD